MCTPSVSNVIYHKFSHGAAFYTLNGKNSNVMLEFFITQYPLLSVNSNNYKNFDKKKMKMYIDVDTYIKNSMEQTVRLTVCQV